MQDERRNPMRLEDITADTPIEIDFTHRASSWYKDKHGHRPTIAYVVAIKPCGCTGPTLGSVETVKLPKTREPQSVFKPPRSWNPQASGYQLWFETKDRIALHKNGERLFGKRWFGNNDLNDLQTAKLFKAAFLRLSWSHHCHTVRDRGRPRHPDGVMHRTAVEAMDRIPHTQCKLWAVYPDRPYRYDRKPKPVGYVWGKEAAAKTLHAWWVAKNAERIAA